MVTTMSDDTDNAPDNQPTITPSAAAFPQGPVAFPNASAPTAVSSLLPSRYQAIARGAAVINQGAEAVGRGVAAGLRAIDKASKELGGSKPAY
jgi:hypothetical protein